MDDEGAADTFLYTVDGKEMVFAKISDTRRVMINRIYQIYAKQLQEADTADDQENYLKHAKKLNDIVWTAIESQITTPEDLDFIHMAIVAGRAELQDLSPLLANGHKPPSQDDDDTPPPAAKPRKRVAKKAPAKRGAR